MVKKYHDVWRIIGTELDIDRNVMKTIEHDHSCDRHRLHALIEVWLNGASLSRTKQMELNAALQSQRVISAMTGASTSMITYFPEPFFCETSLTMELLIS